MIRVHTSRVTGAMILATLAATGVALVGDQAGAEESKDVITVQARILQDGAPVNADLTLTFELYTASSGGTKVWGPETQSNVSVRNGIMSVQLGVSTALGSTFKPGTGGTSERWLAIKQGGAEIVPRIRLTAVPYAQAAGTADIASALWDPATGTSLTLSALVGAGIEQDGSGRLRIAASAAGNGLAGGSGSALSVGGGAGITVSADTVAVAPGDLLDGGTAAVDADRLRIDYGPAHYTPTVDGSGLASAATNLTAHLKGIDDALTSGGGGSVDSAVTSPGGRLSASSSVVVPTTDQTAATSIYYLPYFNNRIPLYDGTKWVVRSFSASGVAASLSGKAANTNYDIFGYWTGTAVALEIGVAWASNSARSSTCTVTRDSDGVYVKDASGTLDRTRRYLGTIRTLAAGQTEDSNAKRFVWNYHNRVPVTSIQQDTGWAWTYNSTTLRGLRNGDPNWKHEVVVGLAEDQHFAEARIQVEPTSGRVARVGMGYDSSTALAAGSFQGNSNSSAALYMTVSSALVNTPAAGYHFYQGLEATLDSTAQTFQAANGTAAMFRNEGRR